MRFPTSRKRDPAIARWMDAHPGVLGAIARRWFDVMRACGADVRELLHDGHPTACVGDAAFGYVNAFSAHVNVGFFRGADIVDPRQLLEGTGRLMRHVKLAPARAVDADALTRLIVTAYTDMKRRAAEEKTMAAKSGSNGDLPAAVLIDRRIAELGDWRGETLSRMRRLIKEADPEVVEEWKWGGPVWSHDGILCTGETYKGKVKLTFAKGAALQDPAKVFNSSLDGNARRAIDIVEGQTVDATAFKALVRAAVALNGTARTTPRRAKSAGRAA